MDFPRLGCPYFLEIHNLCTPPSCLRLPRLTYPYYFEIKDFATLLGCPICVIFFHRFFVFGAARRWSSTMERRWLFLFVWLVRSCKTLFNSKRCGHLHCLLRVALSSQAPAPHVPHPCEEPHLQRHRRRLMHTWSSYADHAGAMTS